MVTSLTYVQGAVSVCNGNGETAMGGVCAQCEGTGAANQSALDAVAHPAQNGKAVGYRVSVGKLSDRPLVGAAEELTHEVVYSVASIDSGFSEEWNEGVVQGDTLMRCLRLREVGGINVSEPSG